MSTAAMHYSLVASGDGDTNHTGDKIHADCDLLTLAIMQCNCVVIVGILHFYVWVVVLLHYRLPDHKLASKV